MKDAVDTLVAYGIPSSLADTVVANDLNISRIRTSSIAVLVSKFQLTEETAKYLKQAVQRTPIERDVIDSLLLNNNFLCCACTGQKSHAFVIHHIDPYHTSQNNAYENLAVLCPSCHDLAHGGRSLALNLTQTQIRMAKESWEKACIARRSGDQITVDAKPVYDIWSLREDIDDMQYLMYFLSIEKSPDFTKGKLDVVNMDRGNTFMAAEFAHPSGAIDADIEVSYWEVQWGIRSSLRKKTMMLITYLHERIMIRDFEGIFAEDRILDFEK